MKLISPFFLRLAVTCGAASLLVNVWAGSHESPAKTHFNLPSSGTAPTTQPSAWSRLGAKAAAKYSGDGLAVFAGENGTVRLRCVFQRLEGEVTLEGLWLTSTVPDAPADRFQVVADFVGREGGAMVALPQRGVIGLETGRARYVRSRLAEEYSVSVDGVRQDFVVTEAPSGSRALRVDLAVNGACAVAAVEGARLVLDGSNRNLAYGRLQVTDAGGRELNARMEVVSDHRLAVVVEDAGAVYPVRIDPTFSDANWVSLGGIPGANDEVHVAVADDLGNVYVGGAFTVIGTVTANYIAKWNGSTWSPLGSGMSGKAYVPDGSPSVGALVMSGTNLYAGGNFLYAGGKLARSIAKWDGTTWSPLGSGIGGNTPIVRALAVSGSDLYVGGWFEAAGGKAINCIAKWDGSTWSALGSGMNSGSDHPFVQTLVVSGTDLYAGGLFTTAGGIPANSIAKWNGSAWSALGSGMDFSVLALAVSGTNLYAGGGFTTAGGRQANYIAKWNGSMWLALGSGANGYVQALALSGTNLYVGTERGIQKWSGSAWSAVGSGLDNLVYALTVSGTNLYVGGRFTTAGGAGAMSIAKWDGSAWSALGEGMNGDVNALAVSGTDVYAGGRFTAAGGVMVNRIAKWNGTQWSALGNGMAGGNPLDIEVKALAVWGTNLYAGGRFLTADGVTVNRVANWDGAAWSALGEGIGGGSSTYVSALAVLGTDLYAGGYFTFTPAGGQPLMFIAKWDGSAWSPLGGGMSYIVNALAVSGTDLYVGGNFSTAGGLEARSIAKWDGSAWSALGSGLNSEVYALAVSGTDLYAGGWFTTAGGSAANHIAKWNGSTWSALGSGINDRVYALAATGTDLYAGGYFTTAGGKAARNIAKWDGSAWSALGSGMNSGVTALAVLGTDLYVGGWFTTAGSKVSGYAAKAVIACAPGCATGITCSSGTAGILFHGTPTYPYDVQRTTSLVEPVVWTTLTQESPLMPDPDGSFCFSDTNAPNGTAYYRSRPH